MTTSHADFPIKPRGKYRRAVALSVSLSLSLASLTLSGAAAAKDGSTIRIGIDPTYPPFESVGKDGTVGGFDVDLGNALCARLKAKCVWVQSSFDGLIPGLQARKFDVILSSMAATAKRREQIDFTDRLYRNQTRLIVGTGTGLMPAADALKGKRIGVEQGTVQESYGRQKWAGAGVQIVAYQNYDQAYADLTSGRIDGVLMDAVQGQQGFLDTPAGKGYGFAGGVVYDPTIMGDGDAAGVRKTDADLRQALDGAIAGILADGTYRRIEKRYFTFDMYGK